MNVSTVLPVTHRYYLAIMAVSCYNCDYLLKILEEQFILHDGDPKWLHFGLKVADPKLRLIAVLNETLAHKPWIVNAKHIHNLFDNSKATEKWNVPELIHAGLILVTYHGLCGLIFGQGLKEEVNILSI
jgi:PA26 p53-induced protein (sestrin)